MIRDPLFVEWRNEDWPDKDFLDFGWESFPQGSPGNPYGLDFAHEMSSLGPPLWHGKICGDVMPRGQKL